MGLNTFDVIIILFFWQFFKWLFRILALAAIGKIIQVIKQSAMKSIKEKLGVEKNA